MHRLLRLLLGSNARGGARFASIRETVTAYPRPTIDEIVVAAEPADWEAAGFRMSDGVVEAGSVRVRPAGAAAGRGIVSWSLRELRSRELDGLPTETSTRAPADGAPHPNGVIRIDHVVVFTPDLERSIAALEEAGLDFRRLREGPTPGGALRQGFFRLGDEILEVIEAPPGSRLHDEPAAPARLWGISFLVEDLDAAGERLGELLGSPRDAVQPGRRIVTLRREAGLGVPVSLITPGPGAV
jgi:catechol 2,3-dioxygenase-like lactoylglutathione lyase family enzyme